MAYDWNEGRMNYIKLNEGDELTLTIKKVEKTTGKFNLKKDGVDQGWHVAVTTDKGILSVNSWGLYMACQQVGIKAGKTYNFKCLTRGGLGKIGQYEITETAPF